MFRVKVIFLDHEGNRQEVLGREGMSVLEVSQWYGLTQPNDPSTPLLDMRSMAGADMEVIVHSPDWKEEAYGEGPMDVLDHVVLPVGVYNKLGLPEKCELQQIEMYVHPTEQTPTSRLASRIVLDKSLDGIVVSVPEPPPHD